MRWPVKRPIIGNPFLKRFFLSFFFSNAPFWFAKCLQTTSWPAFIRFLAMGPPMLPRPMKPQGTKATEALEFFLAEKPRGPVAVACQRAEYLSPVPNKGFWKLSENTSRNPVSFWPQSVFYICLQIPLFIFWLLTRIFIGKGQKPSIDLGSPKQRMLLKGPKLWVWVKNTGHLKPKTGPWSRTVKVDRPKPRSKKTVRFDLAQCSFFSKPRTLQHPFANHGLERSDDTTDQEVSENVSTKLFCGSFCNCQQASVVSNRLRFVQHTVLSDKHTTAWIS